MCMIWMLIFRMGRGQIQFKANVVLNLLKQFLAIDANSSRNNCGHNISNALIRPLPDAADIVNFYRLQLCQPCYPTSCLLTSNYSSRYKLRFTPIVTDFNWLYLILYTWTTALLNGPTNISASPLFLLQRTWNIIFST